MNEVTPAFEARNIVKTYANHTALDNVSISVPPQSIFGLLGPNGAGKTSLIRIINQITAPDSGEILINGEKLRRKHIEDIGYLPEERGLYKKMKIGEQAIYLAQLKGMSRNEARSELKKWFIKFEIESWWNKKVEDLSKGMAQKIQFITTIIHRPKLLILDEPFSGFDPINANLIKNEIMELRDNGATIILSTHNMESVEEICSDMALINKSKKILGGKVSEVKESFSKNQYKIEFKGNMVAFANAVWGGWEMIEKEELNKDHFMVQVKLDEKMELNNFLKGLLEAVEVISFNKVALSMNEIFIKMVKENSQPQTISENK